MPRISFKASIDESGDEGFAFKVPRIGSSHWFVHSAVITRTETDLETVRLVDAVRQILRKRPHQPLHFQSMKHEHRLPYMDQIARAHLRTVSNRGGMSYRELRECMNPLQARPHSGEVRIDWSVIRPDQILARHHETLMGLQIADAVASGFYCGVQQTPLGFTE